MTWHSPTVPHTTIRLHAKSCGIPFTFGEHEEEWESFNLFWQLFVELRDRRRSWEAAECVKLNAKIRTLIVTFPAPRFFSVTFCNSTTMTVGWKLKKLRKLNSHYQSHGKGEGGSHLGKMISKPFKLLLGPFDSFMILSGGV